MPDNATDGPRSAARRSGAGRERPTAILWFGSLGLALLPFLFVTIPPLADAPGHFGQFAIQAAPSGSALRHYFSFTWAIRLNLGTDLLIELLRHVLTLGQAFWLVCAAIPVLTAAAILALARTTGATAAAASFALPLAYSYPFQFGFLNYTLGVALALLGFALWLRMGDQPRRREAWFWLILPALIICHATGGGLLPLMIVADSAARHLWPRPGRAAIGAFVGAIRPVLALIPPVILSHAGGDQGQLALSYEIAAKGNAIVLALRDQIRWLDLASIAIIIAIPLIGLAIGARYRRTGLAVIGALFILFLILPAELNGSSYNDMRIVPPLLILALTLQDWSRLPRRWAAGVMAAGFALFAVRAAVTTAGFVAYARSYAAEARALPHIRPGSRVLALVTRQCRSSRAWRMDRLDHFPVLATAERAAWVNALWDVPSIHLLRVDYRPSPLFYDDPSHYVWPAECVAGEDPERRTIAQAAPLLPLRAVDYLWLIQAELPRGAWDAQLEPLWSEGGSTLYRIRPTRRAAPAPR